MKSANGTDRPLPKKLSFEAEGCQLVRFGFWQAVRLALGYRAVIRIGVYCQHNPGIFSPTIQVALTKHSELVPAMADKESFIPVAQVQPVLDERLELAVERLKENAAKAKAGAN